MHLHADRLHLSPSDVTAFLACEPPVGAGEQVFRTLPVANAGFRDWFGRHDARVDRFRL